jgi:hypothetical protein
MAGISPRQAALASTRYVALYPAEVSVVASLHGLSDRPMRDAVLPEVLDGAVAST